MKKLTDARVFQIDNRNAHDANGLPGLACRPEVNKKIKIIRIISQESHNQLPPNRGDLPPAIGCQAKREVVILFFRKYLNKAPDACSDY